ncbi:NAD(P)-binding protein [Aspergillus pseudoustus]|uniref:NAD(P)-binding protein n=1 Tax=Aspergillus pseudoustus TaxID=1810923 RepID=A0ABR4KYZ1_9EURO
MARSTFEPTIPEGSWILVTGVNGYLASHTADQVLQHGYRVRGTTRNLQKSRWIKELFNQKYGDSVFELLHVKDMTCPGAFDDAVKGVSGVAHVATIFGGDQIPDLSSAVIETNRNLLISAAKEPTVKRFVYTSSSEAAAFTSFHEHDESQVSHITVNTWNDEAVRRSQGNGTAMGPKNGFDMYAASKTLGEQALFEWVEENSPGFVVNTVLPSVCFGPSIDPVSQGHASSSAWPVAIFSNTFDQVWRFLQHIIPTGAYCVDARDVALLHLAGLIHPDVQNERLFAFGNPFSWNKVLSIFRKEFPGRQLPGQLPAQCEGVQLYGIEPAVRAQELLGALGKPDASWFSLADTLKANVADLI